MERIEAAPFVKWAGGKRQLLDEISARMPKAYNKYVEPFVGGGAVLFHLSPKEAVINDINRSLINAYRQIRVRPEELIDTVGELDAGMGEDPKSYYYSMREQYNDRLLREEYDVRLAALFIFLNKHCFNGLYRVNGQGLFNVPYNNSRRQSANPEQIRAISRYLQTVEILEGDFENACERADEGDFVFIDSPYAPLVPTSFESYTKEGFDLESHRRLAQVFERLTKKGCLCMLTNHNTQLIRELYSEYRIDVVDVKRMINSDASNRVGEEVIICNYVSN